MSIYEFQIQSSLIKPNVFKYQVNNLTRRKEFSNFNLYCIFVHMKEKMWAKQINKITAAKYTLGKHIRWY